MKNNKIKDNRIIDGRQLAHQHQLLLKRQIAALKKKPRVVSILVGDDPASVLYIRLKQQKARELGIEFEVLHYPDTVQFSSVAEKIKQLNENPQISAVMVQLPSLPGLVELVSPQKDVDGLTSRGSVLPATVRGILSIIETLGDVSEKQLAVIGSQGSVGKPLAKALTGRGWRLLRIDKRLPGSRLADAKTADIVISCVGEPGLIKPEHIKDGAILIDVGLGDFDRRCYGKASAYTPARGGVGPMTVISLMENVVDMVSGR